MRPRTRLRLQGSRTDEQACRALLDRGAWSFGRLNDNSVFDTYFLGIRIEALLQSALSWHKIANILTLGQASWHWCKVRGTTCERLRYMVM